MTGPSLAPQVLPLDAPAPAATPSPALDEPAAPDLSTLPQVLLSTYGEVVAALEQLRNGRPGRLRSPEDAARELARATRVLADVEQRLYALVSLVHKPALAPTPPEDAARALPGMSGRAAAGTARAADD